MLPRTAKAILLLSFLLKTAVAATTLPSDVRLLQMVPPESQIIASMLRPTPDGLPSSFLLITIYNRLDLEDFYAVTGADASRLVDQVVFVAAAGSDNRLSEHSLLISGHFDRDAIFRFTQSGSAGLDSYRGEPILVVPPLTRERGTFKHVRWLAILNSDIAIFGTPASVRQELDRQIANCPPDPILIQRLSRLDRHDETWFLLPAPSPSRIVESVLDKLDPKLGAVAAEGGSMQFGIHFGSRVEITASSNTAARASSDSENDRSGPQSPAARSFLAASHTGLDDDVKAAVVKISQRRYEEWLHKFSRGNLTIGASLSH
jgi:hypothetical protein